ncbi:hypothetical protein [Microlunatus speluncae]|uniref:hypothetical protein n=1 Tax=Microlunatus speluncae TaxID=2594267 RepID=UPI001266840C|nr:hypothetical protein [Microlunatus speluncae]
MTRLVLDNAGVAQPAVHAPVRPGRPQILADVVLDALELERRERHRALPILSLDLLNLLVTMPLRLPVQADSFSDFDWRILEAGSRRGVVNIFSVDGHLAATRCAAPPLTVQHVTVTTRNWRTGLTTASRFAPYSSRELILERLPADDLQLRLEADYLGVGVSVRGSDPDMPIRQIIEPASFAPARYTGASWLFAERLLTRRTVLDDGY